jgi:hypothetical protein
LIALTGLVNIVQLLVQKEIYPINKIYFGLDYQEFYKATLLFLNGDNPYRVGRFVTPPISAILNIPLTLVSLQKASKIFFIISVLGYLFILSLNTSMFFSDRVQSAKLITLSLITAFFSYPFLFILDRGNIDIIVLLFVFIGIYFWDKNEFLSGFCLALATGLKLYPLLLVIPIIVFRKWKILVALLGSFALFYAVTPHTWNYYLYSTSIIRASSFCVYENGSIIIPFYFLLRSFDLVSGLHLLTISIGLGYSLFFILLCSKIIFDIQLAKDKLFKDSIRHIYYYLPFMVAVPSLVYHYEFVLFLLFIPFFEKEWDLEYKVGLFYPYLLIILGIVLTQFPVVTFEKILKLFSGIEDYSNSIRLIHSIPSFGLIFMLLGTVVLPLKRIRIKTT